MNRHVDHDHFEYRFVIKNLMLASAIGFISFIIVIVSTAYQLLTEDLTSNRTNGKLLQQTMLLDHSYHDYSGFLHNTKLSLSRSNWRYLISPYVNHTQTKRI